jgi:uncharacterized membrane protein
MPRNKRLKPKPTAVPVNPPRALHRRWAPAALATVALAVSTYLLWGSLSGAHLPGCGPDSGCDAVLSTRWGYWLGIPVSFGAVAVYGTLIALALGLRRPPPSPAAHRYEAVLQGLALVLLGAAGWFVFIQLFVIQAICPYCMAAHACGATAALWILLRPQPGTHEPVGKDHPARRRPLLPARSLPAIVAAAALAVLVAGQLLYRPPSFKVEPMSAAISSSGSSSASATSATSGPGSRNSGRFLDLHAGAFRLNLDEVPLMGPADAPHVMVSLFDYTCHHCRAAHVPLVETQRAFSNQLAIISLPVPLDRTCNATVRRQLPAHTNACAYARLGLAVWRADRRRMAAFEDWLFATAEPPSTAAALDRARQLVGTNTLAQALGDRWVDEQIARNARLHRTNALEYGRSQLPQLILGSSLIVGSFDNTPALLDLVSKQFGLVVPAR